jgi:hypothetical protein
MTQHYWSWFGNANSVFASSLIELVRGFYKESPEQSLPTAEVRKYWLEIVDVLHDLTSGVAELEADTSTRAHEYNIDDLLKKADELPKQKEPELPKQKELVVRRARRVRPPQGKASR